MKIQANNRLTLAVAGSRKTQGLVDSCKAADPSERILVLTYTSNNQHELATRLDRLAGDHSHVEVNGWFSFLLQNFVHPFLPLMFEGRRVEGFDFDSPPQMYVATGSWQRYINEQGAVRRVHLPELAVQINQAGDGICMDRLGRVYDRIMIDEVQDLCGYDLEILDLLMASKVKLEMVGDVRQAILATNGREAKHKPFMYMQIWKWFQAQERAGRLVVEQRRETWRCAPEIAAFADSLFGAEWGFEPTVSLNTMRTDHDGIFLIAPEHVDQYNDRYRPILLRNSKASGKQYDHLDCVNFGKAKGLQRPRVLVFPTGPICTFITKAKKLNDQQAANLYVAVTRAQHSVGFIINPPKDTTTPVWTPDTGIIGGRPVDITQGCDDP
ncbi:ATP-dependent helicase [Mycobacterium sp. 21AC1]|uniref:UvrD-helicase domain-containing protein n=1 Tax=[Mycobacterium] appelbergii TaxID=2939269 RepID=UPI002938E6D8|nr:UvrD-helicase domain-containing protein [Mycobacterium sp. 21AC1]MDV3125941.1 ATP-dependent helicase [Mycobacterium sp. 21AC1]